GAAASAQPAEQRRVDHYGDPLPPGAVLRLGTIRYRHGPARALLPDGETAVSTKESSIQFWDLRTGRPLREIDLGNLNVGGDFALSRDGRYLAIGGSLSDDTKPGWRSVVRVLALPSGKEVRTFERDP